MEGNQEQKTLEALRKVEAEMDRDLKAMTALGKEDLRVLRRKRELCVKEEARVAAQRVRQGRGLYQEVQDQQKWFDEAKSNDRMICHFSRGTTWRCELLDAHLTVLARLHPEARFIKINAEKSPFLAERLGIEVLPCLVMTKDNFVHDTMEGFGDLGSRDDFSARDLELRLTSKGMIDFDPENPAPEDFRPGATAETKGLNRRTKTGILIDSDSEEDW